MTNNGNSVEKIVPAVLTLLGTSMVVVTYLVFNKLREFRFVEIVFYIALSDLMGATGVVLGSVGSGTSACYYQAFASNYFFLASIMWTTVVSYQLYLIVCSDGALLDLKYYHVFIWLFPLIVTLLPLTTNTFGTNDDISWCFLADRPDSPEYGILLWTILSFYLWLWICVALIVFFYVSIRIKLSQLESIPVAVTTAMYKLQLYPTILIVCWIIPTINDIHTAIQGYDKNITVDKISAVMPGLQGALLSIVFFQRNKLVTDQWVDVLSGRESFYNKLKGIGGSSDGGRRRGSASEASRNNRSSNMTLSSGIESSRGSDMSIKHTLSSEMTTYHASESQQAIMNEMHNNNKAGAVRSPLAVPRRVDEEDDADFTA